MATNERTIITAPSDLYVDLPAHVFVNRTCAYCGDSENSESYAEYVERWYDTVFEGEPGHTPDSEEVWSYLHSTCLS